MIVNCANYSDGGATREEERAMAIADVNDEFRESTAQFFISPTLRAGLSENDKEKLCNIVRYYSCFTPSDWLDEHDAGSFVWDGADNEITWQILYAPSSPKFDIQHYRQHLDITEVDCDRIIVMRYPDERWPF